MTFCSSSKVAVFSLLTIDVDLCLNMSEDLNQIYCRRSLDMNTSIECSADGVEFLPPCSATALADASVTNIMKETNSKTPSVFVKLVNFCFPICLFSKLLFKFGFTHF